ncbi:MAG: hypothetical protein IJ690_01610 [Clostridia bacterium]|nr:hypothetical protein [Clostridia bacterium]MBR1653639.1 hypothetical protein [Clostridia bacterium]
MKLETKNKSVELVVKTRKIVDIANTLKNKKFEEVFFTSMRECDIEALTKIIYILAEDKTFKNSTEVYDFMDDYIAESGKTFDDIYLDIATEINEKGFFRVKMTPEQLMERVNDILSSVNLDGVVKDTIEKMATQVVTEEFKGYKA